MTDWEETILSEIAEIIPGFAFKSHEFGELGDLVIKIKDINPPYIDLGGAQRVNTSNYSKERLDKYRIQQNDYVVAMTGATIGKVGRMKEKNVAYINQRVAKIKAKDKIDNDFVYYSLMTNDFQTFIQNNIDSHSAQENISGTSIGRFPILLPEIKLQKSIASLLKSLDDKIELLIQQNNTLEQLALVLFKYSFIEKSLASWEDTVLEKHTETHRGLSYKGSGLSENESGLPMHNLNSVYEGGGYKYEGIKYYTGEYRERHLIKPGDIIVTNTEQGHEFKLIGFPAIVPDTFGNVGLFSQHIYRLVPNNQTYLTNQFLYYLLLTPSIREQIIAATNGSTVNMLAIDGLQRPEFKLPPKDLVEQFTVLVSSYWKKRDNNQAQIKTLSILRNTLIPKLMNGEATLSGNA